MSAATVPATAPISAPTSAPITVAVADVQSHLLTEAIGEARRASAPLHVVTCWDPEITATDSAFGENCFGDASPVMENLAREAVDQVHDFIEANAPELEVTYSMCRGLTSDVLREESRVSRQVMVGAGGDLLPCLWMFRGAVARRLVRASTRTTIIVPDRDTRPDGDVLLVLPTWAPEAVRFALQAAEDRGSVLHVVHESDGVGLRAHARWTNRCHALDLLRTLFPDVEVVIDTTPRGGLVGAASRVPSTTGLVVVSSIPRPHRPWFLDRSVAGRLATRTRVPLAVVPMRRSRAGRRAT